MSGPILIINEAPCIKWVMKAVYTYADRLGPLVSLK